jgi:hypothetical protein
MLDREVDMAIARLRMRFLEMGGRRRDAYHVAAHHVEEGVIRHEQVRDGRLVETARTRVESGRAPQAEMLEVVAELCERRATSNTPRPRRQPPAAVLNSFLDRAADALLLLAPHETRRTRPGRRGTPRTGPPRRARDRTARAEVRLTPQNACRAG